MRPILLVSSLFCSTAALAQLPPPSNQSQWQGAPATPPPSDGPGNGLQLDIDPFGVSGFFAPTTTTGAAFGFSSTPSLAIGYQFDQNALLLDLGFAATSGTDIFFQVAPTFRRYLSPLRAGSFMPFGQGSIVFAIAAPSGAPASFGLGLNGGFGGEWLFTKNMGLEGYVTLGYTHTNSDNFNTDAIGFGSNIGLVIHL